AERTPLTAIRIGELALEAGLPEGVFQVLPGKGSVVGQRLIDHADVRKIVFTGSSEGGREGMAGLAPPGKRGTMELGGKSANIVFADADLERAAATAPVAAFDNAGQDCCARSRILVQREVYQRFLELLEPAVKAVAVGDPAREDTEMGPLISAEHRDRGAAYVPDGAPVAFRGSAPDGAGYWDPPTVPAAGRPGRPPHPRGSGRWSPWSRSRARPRRWRWPTTPPTACPARCGPGTWAGPSGWRGAWRPATCRSIPTPRSVTGRRSAASSSPGSAGNWGPMPST